MSQDRGMPPEDEQKKGDGTAGGDRRLPPQVTPGTDLFGNPLMPAASDQSSTGDRGALFGAGTPTGSTTINTAAPSGNLGVSIVTWVVAGLCGLAIFICAGLIAYKMLTGHKDTHEISMTSSETKTSDTDTTSTTTSVVTTTSDLTPNEIYKVTSPSVVTLKILSKSLAIVIPKCKLIDPFSNDELNKVMAFPGDDGNLHLYQKGKQVEKVNARIVLPNGDKLAVLVQLVGKKLTIIAATADGQPLLKGGHTIEVNVPAALEGYTEEATGSGFFVRHDIVATNWHVVSNQAMGDAGFRGGTAQITDKPGQYTITDKPIAFDRDHDLALLYVPGTEAKPLTLEPDYRKLRVGEAVYALGSPWGLAGSLSEGIVSSDQLRQGDASNGNARKLYIQHSAKIDHGFSGGPLLDGKGHVIGVDTAHEGNGAVNLSVAAHFIDDLLDRPSTQAQIERLSKAGQVDLHG